MKRTTRTVVRLGAVAGIATAMTLVPASAASARAGFTPSQATAATSPCVPIELPHPDGWSGEVMDINDSGVMVGTVIDPDGVDHATYWAPNANGGFTRHTPDLPAAGELLDVNNAGEAVGFDDFTYETYVFNTVTGAFRYLPDYAGTRYGRARRINSSGVVAGASQDPNGTWIATTWSPPYDSPHRVGVPWEQQAMTYTFPDGSQQTFIAGSEADGINDAGTVAVFAAIVDPHIMRAHGRSKFSRNPGDSTHPIDGSNVPSVPMTKTASGRVILYHTGGDQAYTFALNNTGLVVGDDVTDLNSYDTRPVYWTGSAEHDLGMPADAEWARALNVDGSWVTGFIAHPDGTWQSYVWTGGGLLQVEQNLPGWPATQSHGVDQALHEVAGSAMTVDHSQSVPVMWQCPADFSTAR